MKNMEKFMTCLIQTHAGAKTSLSSASPSSAFFLGTQSNTAPSVAEHTSHVSRRSTLSKIIFPLASLGNSSSPAWIHREERIKKVLFKNHVPMSMELGHPAFRRLWLLKIRIT
jgi:hypothetical protein